jgi:DNA (cytosine-5)-methyltransferase 1
MYDDPAAVLREARRQHTQKALASFLDLTPRTIARWEHGHTPIPPLVVPALREIMRRPAPVLRDSAQFTFIDLFAGIGGIRLAFEQIGGSCVFTSEWDPYSQRTYRANFPADAHPITGDIQAVDEDDVPDHDVLLAGFPCQPFSIAGVSKKNALGRPHGFECATQGTLFFDVARIIARKRPAAFLLENVKNLVSHDRGNTFRVIRETLQEQLGYHIHWQVIDARVFVPQHRERILIAGFREDVDFDWQAFERPLDLSVPTMSRVLHREDGTEPDVDEGRFVTAEGQVQSKYVLSSGLWKYLKDYAEKHRAKGNGFGFGMVGPDSVARTLSARYYKDGSEILVNRGSRRNPRRLTPRECARLMGFPDSWKIPVSDTRAYKQFGNSVVVPVVSAAARLMRPGITAIVSGQEILPKQPRLF